MAGSDGETRSGVKVGCQTDIGSKELGTSFWEWERRRQTVKEREMSGKVREEKAMQRKDDEEVEK